jgi:hypothetical protein
LGYKYAAVTQKFLPVGRQNQPAIEVIKEPKSYLSLQSLDLTGERGLGDPHSLGRSRYRAALSNRNEGSHVLQIHRAVSCQIGMTKSLHYALDCFLRAV